MLGFIKSNTFGKVQGMGDYIERITLLLSKQSVLLLLVYIIIATSWVFTTDQLLQPMADESDTAYLLISLKDWIFIVVSGLVLVYFASRKREAQKDLASTERKYQKLFQHSSDGIMLTNPDGSILKVNPAGCRILGRKEEEIKELGREGITKNDEKMQEALKRREETGHFSGELTFIHKSDKHIPVELTSSVFHSEDEGLQTSIIFRDITDRKKHERLLQDQIRMRATIMEVGAKALEADELTSFYEMLTKEMTSLLDAQRTHLFRFTEDSVVQQLASSPPLEASLVDGHGFADLQTLNTPQIIQPDQLRPLTQQLPDASVSYGVIIPGDSGPLGFVAVQYADDYELNTNDELFLKAVAHIISITTARKQAEQQLQQSLDEKKTLLAEIHHRIKNNLAVISGLLEVQAIETEDEHVRFTLQDSQQRIQTIATIHEKLYQSSTLAEVGTEQFIQDLIRSIHDAHNPGNQRDITYETDIEDIDLDMDRAIPLGLIVNELVSNTYKHAFEEQEQGHISIRLESKNDMIRLQITDNGKGLPEDFTLQQSSSLGMNLIQTLTHQLEGQLEYQNTENGCEFIVTAPFPQ
ncbi:histidine kinase dimerization/phosphoacceptor domain -containing protein [Fodinibius sp. SL11]|uniref:sensor histidine kinase n=1 Tax=Fodinibius sp. SL11 TaxID=3425690 RepID=UPI003F8815A1